MSPSIKKPVVSSKTASKQVVKPTLKPVVKPAPKTATKAIAKPAINKVASKSALPIAPMVAAVVEKVEKLKKVKLVRDSFTVPKNELNVLGDLKLRALSMKLSIKKSELLRAGIKALAAMDDAAFVASLNAVPTLKTGRPKK